MNWMQVREILDDIFEVAIKSPDYSVSWEHIPDSFKNLEQVSRIEMWGYMERYGVIDDKNIFNGNFKGYKLNKEWIGFAESGGWRAISKATRKAELEKEKAEMRAQSALREAKKANWIALVVGICTLLSFFYQTISAIRMKTENLPCINVGVSIADDIDYVINREVMLGKYSHFVDDTINVFIHNRAKGESSDILIPMIIRLEGDSTISFGVGNGGK